MGISIVTNTASLTGQRHLGQAQGALSASLGRLASGLRINSAADDAAGLAISEKFRAQIRGIRQAERNAMDGVSMLQTAEGAMNEVSGILTRMRELGVQSANGTLGDTERGFLQEEFGALRDELNRIADTTEFNGMKVLDGSTTSVTLQVGINDTANDRLDVALVDAHAANLGDDGTNSIATLDISTAAGAQAALGTVDSAISDVSSARARFGAAQNRLDVTVNNLSTARENIAAANSRIRDVDVAEESASMTRAQVLVQSGMAVLSQANQMPSMALSLLR